MNILVENGAGTDWTEPSGFVVNKAEILDWCGLSEKQLALQPDFDFAFCRVSGDTYEYPLYATRSQVERYRRTDGFTSADDAGSNRPDDEEQGDLALSQLDGESIAARIDGEVYIISK